MDEDDDDLYDPADSFPPQQETNGHAQHEGNVNADEPYEVEGEEEEEEEEEDDDDFNIITEAPTDAPSNLAQHPRHIAVSNEPGRSTSADIKPPTPSIPTQVDSGAAAHVQGRPVATLKPGTAYPAIHTSTVDVDADPIHPATGKPVTATDMDADFPSEEDKPWRRPGSDITDFFNYGFDEFTWASYCLKQQGLRNEVSDQKKQLEDMQNFITMGAMPGMPGAPPPPQAPAPPAQGGGPGGMPGMPAMPAMPGMQDMSPDMMQGMLASMMSQGLDPSSMDPMAFMQHAQAMMQPGGGQQNQGYGGQGNQQQMAYGGYNQQGGYGGGRGRGGGRRW